MRNKKGLAAKMELFNESDCRRWTTQRRMVMDNESDQIDCMRVDM